MKLEEKIFEGILGSRDKNEKGREIKEESNEYEQ